MIAVNVVCTVRARYSRSAWSNEKRNIALKRPKRKTIVASVIEAMISSTAPNWERLTWWM